MKNSIHEPVLLQESVNLLNVRPGNTYVDLTLGGGGHSLEILKLLGLNKHSRLICFDQDEEAIERFSKKLKDLGYKQEEKGPDISAYKLELAEIYTVNRNFEKLSEVLDELKIDKVNGIIADLGLSSDQLEQSGRGFSFKNDEELDMRMSNKLDVKAKDLINVLGEKQLAKIFWEYGDEVNSRKIAKAIVERRSKAEIITTGDLLKIINSVGKNKSRRNLRDLLPATRVFQALRIAVNQEIDSLLSVLPQTLDCTVAGSRVVFISFHSGEDKIVKNVFRDSAREGKVKLMTKKPITPTENEIRENNRSRSAKMRVVEKL